MVAERLVELPPDAAPSERAAARAEGFRLAWQQRQRIDQATVDIEFIDRPRDRRYFLFRAAIDDARAFHGHTPQLWWPEDHTWFVSTEIDGHSTYVGTSRACVDAILASGLFEALPVPLDVRVD